ncbi:uncharacterized protein LTR77_006523 [Saxophila tyrrhenica]|uniref:C2H2-type domain-containing protein n=1 Tax=Saxophila tyrrhenica TaxID=1690608 RepID=A0AAV9P966_9PEZI|nr:hypothetical protein LTR77_006523 [Saxophila tyrrhenica]
MQPASASASPAKLRLFSHPLPEAREFYTHAKAKTTDWCQKLDPRPQMIYIMTEELEASRGNMQLNESVSMRLFDTFQETKAFPAVLEWTKARRPLGYILPPYVGGNYALAVCQSINDSRKRGMKLECSYCSSSYPLHQYNDHLSSNVKHTLTDRPLVCPVCDKRTFTVEEADPGLLNKPAKTPHAEHVRTCQRYPCSQCSETFTFAHSRDDHFNWHQTTDRPHTCEQCEQAFVSKFGLKRTSTSISQKTTQGSVYLQTATRSLRYEIC